MSLLYEIERLKTLQEGRLLQDIHVESNIHEFCVNCGTNLVYLTKGNPHLKPCCVMYLAFPTVIHYTDLHPSATVRSINSTVEITDVFFIYDTYTSTSTGEHGLMPVTFEDLREALRP